MTADLSLSIVDFFPFILAFIHFIFIVWDISQKKSNDCQITIDIDDGDENDGFDFDSDNEDDGKSQLASYKFVRFVPERSTLFSAPST